MRFRCVSLLWAAPLVSSQVIYSQALTPSSETSPNRTVATVNGRKFTQQDFDRLLASMTPEVRKAALNQPREVLEQYATFQVLLADAEAAKLAEKSPYREQLSDARRQILIQAQLAELSNSAVASPETLKRDYETDKARYTEARVKVIFVSLFSDDKSAEGKSLGRREGPESKKLAEDVMAKLKGGGDFAEVAKKYSDDGSTADTGANYPDTITGTSAGMPPAMRDSILAANQGDLLGPFEHGTGYYIFRVESIKRKTFEEASKDIVDEMRKAKVQEKISDARKRATVEILPPESQK